MSKTPETLITEIEAFNKALLNGTITDLEKATLVARNYQTIAKSHTNTINAVKTAMKLGIGGNSSIRAMLAEPETIEVTTSDAPKPEEKKT